MAWWAAALASLFLIACSTPTVLSAPTDLSGLLIVVDPGHGGTDPGASGFGLNEKTVTLDIGLRLRDLLVEDGAAVLMTRTTDATVSLSARVAIANDNLADRFVSVHANACGACGGHGTETYYHDSLPPTSTSANFAGHAQSEVVGLLGTKDRGVKTADFFVLRNTNMPAILVETAFIDEAGDNALLADPGARQEFARAILHATQAHFGVPVHDPGGPDVTPPQITITAPDLAKWQTGTVTVAATITDASGLAWARAQVNGGAWLWDSTPPHQWMWDTTMFADGSRSLHLQSKDAVGNVGDLLATLKVDNTAPEVSITHPSDGSIVFLSTDVTVDALDAASGIDRVEFRIDGELRASDDAAPFQWHWNALLEPGFHQVDARAFDRAGLSAEDAVDVLVL